MDGYPPLKWRAIIGGPSGTFQGLQAVGMAAKALVADAESRFLASLGMTNLFFYGRMQRG
jgi:hypothetical protein